MKPNLFYFLHIDKTINVSIDINIMHRLYKKIGASGTDISLNIRHLDHNKWRDLEETAFIFSIFRDPVDRTIADFMHSMIYDDFGVRRVTPHGAHIDDGTAQSLENFEKWLHTIHTPNYQSRILHNGLNNVGFDLISERLDRIDLLIKDSALCNQNKQSEVANYILNNLGIDEAFKVPWLPEHLFAQRYSIGFYREKIRGTALEKTIRNMNNVDVFIYENNSNFDLL